MRSPRRFLLPWCLLPTLLVVWTVGSSACGGDDTDRGAGGNGAGGGAGAGIPVGGSPPVAQASCDEPFAEDAECPAATGRTFYVSSSEGSDANDGLSAEQPLASLAAVNALELGPGDQVFLRCGDTWYGEALVVTKTGAECQHIVFGSYPERTCAEQPRLSGSWPITGWTSAGAGRWVASLDEGDNAGHFGQGINQLFRDGQRLGLGKWPNADDDAFMHGYSTIDRQPDATSIEDDELPAADWTGAIIRLKTIRWLLLSRQVVSASGSRLGLNDAVECWGGSCGDPSPSDPADHGWGYLVTNHLATLDQEGEWYYDAAARQIYLQSAAEPSGIEGSVIPDWVSEDSDWQYTGAVVLGNNLAEHVQYVVIENLRIENWFSSGITTPINLELDDDGFVTIRCNTIRNVESVGINLATWVWNAGDDSGWRGGHDQVIANNVIDGPNHFGIHSYARSSTFQGNVVQNVGLAENLGAAGLGCGFEGSNCTEHGGGIHVVVDQPSWSSSALRFVDNRVERTGYCGFDLFGAHIELQHNVIREACYTKGDCGAVRTFGRDGFATSTLDDITLDGNVIVDVIGNTDGDSSAFKTLFGFGLYIDNYSKNVRATGNTVTGCTAAGVLFQNSQGELSDNVLYDNLMGQVSLSGETLVQSSTGNVFVALEDNASTMSLESAELLSGSDANAFIAPWDAQHISAGGELGLSDWQTQTGMDGSSFEAWFTQGTGEAPRAQLFVNDTAEPASVTLAGSYVDLQQNPVTSPLELPPYGAVVLVGP